MREHAILAWRRHRRPALFLRRILEQKNK